MWHGTFMYLLITATSAAGLDREVELSILRKVGLAADCRRATRPSTQVLLSALGLCIHCQETGVAIQ